jgi:hypothetical protein
MKMLRLGALCAAAALGVGLLGSSAAQAEMVNYTTIGTFSGGDTPGTSTYTDSLHGIRIVFANAINSSVDAPPTSQASLGQFDTSGTTATTLQDVMSGFTLRIFQDTPSGGTLTFKGTLSGSLAYANSQAIVQFNSPMVGHIGTGFYMIASADSKTPGRINLSAATSNAGLTTVSGNVGVSAVPEPTSLALVGLGVPLLVLYRVRRRVSATA